MLERVDTRRRQIRECRQEYRAGGLENNFSTVVFVVDVVDGDAGEENRGIDDRQCAASP